MCRCVLLLTFLIHSAAKRAKVAFIPAGSHPVMSGRHFGGSGASVKMRKNTGPTLMAAEEGPLDATRRKFMTSASVAGLFGAMEMPYAASAATPPDSRSNIYQPAPGSLTGQTILITGANTGLGLESGKRLAKAGARVVLTARSQDKADKALAGVKDAVPNADVKSLVLDLANLESVRSFPSKCNSAVGAPLDVLMANAGVMAIPERLSTADGFEKTVGINHLGHFALVSGMLPMLRKAPDGFRVITVSSAGHQIANRESMNAALASDLDPKDYALNGWGAYGLSKAANIMFADELQRRLDAAGIPGSAVSLHPGGVATDLGRYLIQGVEAAEAGVPLKETLNAMNPIQKTLAQGFAKVAKTVEEGANTQVFLAAAADSKGDLTKDGGKYFDEMKAAKPADFTNDRELQSKLWEVSERLTGSKIL